MKNLIDNYRSIEWQWKGMMWTSVLMCIALFTGMWASAKDYDSTTSLATTLFFVCMFIVLALMLHLKYERDYNKRRFAIANSTRSTQYIVYRMMASQIHDLDSQYAVLIAVTDDKTIPPPEGYDIAFTFPSYDNMMLYVDSGWILRDEVRDDYIVLRGFNATGPIVYQMIADDDSVHTWDETMTLLNDEPDYDNMAREYEQQQFEADNFEGYGNYRQ